LLKKINGNQIKIMRINKKFISSENKIPNIGSKKVFRIKVSKNKIAFKI
jgi:hypothetical protein